MQGFKPRIVSATLETFEMLETNQFMHDILVSVGTFHKTLISKVPVNINMCIVECTQCSQVPLSSALAAILDT